MKKKIICIGILSIFLTMSLATCFSGAEEIEASNQEKLTFLIEVGCKDNRELSWWPYYYPDDIITDIEITNLNTNEKIFLTEDDMGPNDYIMRVQCYYVELERESDYNII